MPESSRTTFKITGAGRSVVDFSTLRKGDEFALKDHGPQPPIETGDVVYVALSDAYLQDGVWGIECEEATEEITNFEDDPTPATVLGEPDCPPIVDDLPRVVETVKRAANTLKSVAEKALADAGALNLKEESVGPPEPAERACRTSLAHGGPPIISREVRIHDPAVEVFDFDKIEEFKAGLAFFNRMDLKKVRFVRGCKIVDVPESVLEDFEYTGLNNTDLGVFFNPGEDG